MIDAVALMLPTKSTKDIHTNNDLLQSTIQFNWPDHKLLQWPEFLHPQLNLHNYWT
jgi:hypothetical protein